MNSYRNSDPRPPIMTGSPSSMIVPPLDWDRGPWNRWAFQHVREILPTVEVWRGNGHRGRFARKECDLDMLAVETSRGDVATLAGLLDETYTDGFLVLKEGAIAYERYFNGMTERTLHLSQSMAKSVTGTLAGILIGRGLMDPAAKVTAYLPELEQTGWDSASLQQVLDMTTGVKFSEAYTDRYSEIGQVDVASGWKPVPPGSDPAFEWPRHMWELVLRLKQTTRPHGAAFEYRSIETDVIALAMERVTGKRLAELVSEEIWQKIGAEENASFTVDPAGYALADAGFSATLRDYGRFGQMILEQGAGIVPSEWINATRSGKHSADFHPSLPRGSYRNQFWIMDPDSRTLMCKGVFGQFIIIDFEHSMVAVKLSSYPDFTNDAYSIATYRAVQAIALELT
ncbi:MAG: class C beta-lactamase-related serine hydrolase [Mesorhizobium sp.]|uniref:serine hydrolase domain-containing protein n=1 Tax=Mesorhizobium sp. TaxID=1871066 RepID=UPI000FE8FDB6|nr:serine hydrolase [Mesorhizobium sp.]RWI48928.1 MAG: class C beta-lactamase-related serine hydrolase [Mesorhizobium sp.]